MGRKIEERDGKQRSFGLKAEVALKIGHLVFLEGTVAVPGRSGVAADFDLICLGVSEDEITGGANDGDVRAQVRRGIYQLDNNPADEITIADIGSNCFALDAETVSRQSGGATRPRAGTIYDVDATGVWVEFS